MASIAQVCLFKCLQRLIPRRYIRHNVYPGLITLILKSLQAEINCFFLDYRSHEQNADCIEDSLANMTDVSLRQRRS